MTSKTYRGDCQRELGHGVEGGRAAVEDLLDEGGEGRAGSPVLGEGGDLLLGGDLAGEEEPEETLGQRLRPTGGLGEGLLALGDGLATEANALLCVGGWGKLPDRRRKKNGMPRTSIENGTVPDEGGETTHATAGRI